MESEIPVRNSIAIESTASAVKEVCHQILRNVAKHGFADDDVFAIHLAIEEAFANAVEHGNKKDASKKVNCEYLIAADRFEIDITDQGEGFDPQQVPDPRYGKNLYRSDGRGLLLMRSYMDVAEYNDKGNCIHMVRYRNRPAAKKVEK